LEMGVSSHELFAQAGLNHDYSDVSLLNEV
jgi:hypothetical protein